MPAKRGGLRVKQPKKPTLEQKKIIAEHGFRWKNWSVLNEDNVSITIISKKSGKKWVLLK